MEKVTKNSYLRKLNWIVKSRNLLLFSVLILWICSLKVQYTAATNVHVEKLHIMTKIRYRFGQTKVFCQMQNNASKAEEASFTMVLPDDAFVSSFGMEIDGQPYSSYIEERTVANSNYSTAQSLGQTAGIINQEPKNIFNISINLEANKTILFHLEYEEEIVLTTGPNPHYQYAVSIVPQAELEVKHFCIDVEILEFKNFTMVSLNLCNNSCVQLELTREAIVLQRSRSKRIIWEPTAIKGKLKELQEKGVLGQYKLNYKFNESESINEVLVNNGFFLHRFIPKGLKTIPVHVIFVLDISESMIGQRMLQMTKAIMKILSDLKQHDYFSIITFSTESKIWNKDDQMSQIFTTTSIQAAKTFIQELRYHGSTNIYAALMDSLTIAKLSSKYFKNFANDNNFVQPSPMIFFLTDGQATSGLIESSEILEKVRQRNANISVPIFSLAFGSSADYSLLQGLSGQNNGIARRVFDNSDAADVLEDFYEFVASPVLKNLIVTYTSDMKLADLTLDQHPWLSVNTEISVIGKIDASHYEKDHEISVNAKVSGEGFGTKVEDFKVSNYICGRSRNLGKYDRHLISNEGHLEPNCGDGEDQVNYFVERYWVHKMLRKMITQVNQGNNSVVATVIELAMQYNIVTPFTSLVVIIPYDKLTKTNRKNLESPSTLSKQILRDKDKEDKSLLEMTKPTNKNPVKWTNVSTANSSGLNLPKRETVTMYLERLISEQEKAKKLAMQEALMKRPELDDIQWLNSTSSYKLILVNREDNKINTFNILRSLQRPQQAFPACNIGNDKTLGKCTHLLNCVQREFLNDRDLFVKSYFCPLIASHGSFAGSCCPT